MEDLSHYNPEGSVLRRAQMRMLEMLDTFVDICDRHNINYWLACGTLLGARRHEGFIPWDDDMDIVVLQKDYNKLLSILQKELPEKFKLQARGIDKDYWNYYARIRDTKSVIHQKKPRNIEYKGIYTGIFIDILPIEPIPSYQLKKKIDTFLYREIYYKQSKSIKNAARKAVLPIIRFLILLMRTYYKYIASTKLYTYAYGVFFYATYNIENFYPVSKILFEGKKYKAPGNVDKYLIENFNHDFMVIPKPADRQVHALKIDFF